MKRYIFLFTILLFAVQANSQYKVEVEYGMKKMSQGEQMAVSVFVPEAHAKDIETVWRKYVNNRKLGERIGTLATQIGNIFKGSDNQTGYDRLRVEKKGDEWYVRSIEESTITSHSLDIYAQMNDQSEGCLFSAFFQFTDSIFINESNVSGDRLESLKSYIRDFGVEAYQSVVDDQIKEAKKEVAVQEKILKKMEGKTRQEERAITRAESDIQKFNAEIFEVESDIVRLGEVISGKKSTYTGVTKDSPEYDLMKDELKDLSKQKSKYFREIKSFKNRIKSKEQDIRSSQRKIVENELRLIRQQSVIQEKELIVEQLNQKKAGIN